MASGDEQKLTQQRLEAICRNVQACFRLNSSAPSTFSSAAGDVQTKQLAALYELQGALTEDVKPIILAIQSKLENLLLTKVVPHANSIPMTGLASACVVRTFKYGNSRGLNDAFTTLRQLLVAKEVPCRLGPLHCIAELTRAFGRVFVSAYFKDTTALLLKVLKNGKEDVNDSQGLREAVLRTLAALLQNSSDEETDYVVKIINRTLSDTARQVRLALPDVLTALIDSGVETREIDTLLPHCLKLLDDPDTEVRLDASTALADMLLSTIEAEQRVAAREKEAETQRRMSKRVYRLQNLENAFVFLQQHFVRSPAVVRTSLAHCLMCLFKAHENKLQENTVEMFITHALKFLKLNKSTLTGDAEGRQAAKCIAYALRHGLLSLLRERQLEVAATQLLKVLSAHGSNRPDEARSVNEFQLLCALQELAFCFHRLKTAVEDSQLKKTALDAILPLFSDAKLWTRIHAAQCLRQLARAAPTQAATWIRIIHSVFFIHLTELDPEGPLAGDESQMQVSSFYMLHGHTYALAALIGIVTELPHGVPTRLIDDVFDGAFKLFAMPCEESKALQARRSLREAAWLLVGSLVSLGQDPEWVMSGNRLKQLFGLWKSCLGTSRGFDGMDEKEATKLSPIKRVERLNFHLRERAQALMALRAFVSVYRGRLQDPQHPASIRKQVLLFLAKTFALLSKLEEEKGAASDKLQPAIASVRSLMCDVYCLLTPAEFAKSFRPLLHMVVPGFTSSSRMKACSIIYDMLHRSDDVLGPHPWGVPVLNNFYQLAQSKESIFVNHTWNWSVFHEQHKLDFSTSFSDEDTSTQGELELNTRDRVWNTMVRTVDSSIRLFARIFPSQSDQHKHQLLKHFVALYEKAAKSDQLDSNVIENIAAAVLGICRELNIQKVSMDADDAREHLLTLCSSLLANPRPQVRRAAGESLGLLCRVEDRSFLDRVVKMLEKVLGEKDLARRTAAAFALGTIHRYCGAMKTLNLLPYTVATLQIVGRTFEDPHRTWILHALYLAVDTGGLTSLSEYVAPILSLLYMHAMRDPTSRPAAVDVALLRITAALARALGPELAEPSPANGVVKLMAVFERLQYARSVLAKERVLEIYNQFILWIPDRMDRDMVIAAIRDGLASGFKSLQLIAASCLIEWLRKRPDVVLAFFPERFVMKAFDTSPAAIVCDKLERVYQTVLESLDAIDDSKDQMKWRLIEICKRTVVGSHKLPSDSTADNKQAVGDDDEDDTGMMVSHSSGDTGGPPSRSEPHVNTRVFAAQWLCRIIKLYKSKPSPADFDLKLARKQPGRRLIVSQLLDLITVACMACSTPHNHIRVAGLRVMQVVVECFAESKDPEDEEEEELLLTLYQAQITSTLKSTLVSDVSKLSPDLRAVACAMASSLLVSGITADKVVIGRIIKLLHATLKPSSFGAWEQLYDGSSVSLAALAHLTSLAKIELYCHEHGSKKKAGAHVPVLLRCMAPMVAELRKLYCLALRDLYVVRSQPRRVLKKLSGTFFVGQTSTGVRPTFSQHFSSILPAAVLAVSECKSHAELDSDSLPGKAVLPLLAAVCVKTFHTHSQDVPSSEDVLDLCLRGLEVVLQPQYLVTESISKNTLCDIISLLSSACRKKTKHLEGVQRVAGSLIGALCAASDAQFCNLMSEQSANSDPNDPVAVLDDHVAENSQRLLGLLWNLILQNIRLWWVPKNEQWLPHLGDSEAVHSPPGVNARGEVGLPHALSLLAGFARIVRRQFLHDEKPEAVVDRIALYSVPLFAVCFHCGVCGSGVVSDAAASLVHALVVDIWADDAVAETDRLAFLGSLHEQLASFLDSAGSGAMTQSDQSDQPAVSRLYALLSMTLSVSSTLPVDHLAHATSIKIMQSALLHTDTACRKAASLALEAWVKDVLIRDDVADSIAEVALVYCQESTTSLCRAILTSASADGADGAQAVRTLVAFATSQKSRKLREGAIRRVLLAMLLRCLDTDSGVHAGVRAVALQTLVALLGTFADDVKAFLATVPASDGGLLRTSVTNMATITKAAPSTLLPPKSLRSVVAPSAFHPAPAPATSMDNMADAGGSSSGGGGVDQSAGSANGGKEKTRKKKRKKKTKRAAAVAAPTINFGKFSAKS